MEPIGGTLALIGAVGVIAAIVGGNVHLPGGTKFGDIKNGALRWVLGLTSLVFFALGVAVFTSILPVKTINADPPVVTPRSVLPSPTTDPPTSQPASRSPAATTASTVQALEAAYRKSANAACVESRKRSAAGPQPVSGDPEAIATYASSLRDTLSKTAIDLGAIKTPDTVRSSHDAMVADVAEMSFAYGKAAEALQLGEAQQYDAVVTVLEHDTATLKRLATQLGLKDCAALVDL